MVDTRKNTKRPSATAARGQESDAGHHHYAAEPSRPLRNREPQYERFTMRHLNQAPSSSRRNGKEASVSGENAQPFLRGPVRERLGARTQEVDEAQSRKQPALDRLSLRQSGQGESSLRTPSNQELADQLRAMSKRLERLEAEKSQGSQGRRQPHDGPRRERTKEAKPVHHGRQTSEDHKEDEPRRDIRHETRLDSATGPFCHNQPFSEALVAYQVPKGFKYPTNLEPYDGTTDPQEHLDVYFTSITFTGGNNEPLTCRAFPLSLRKAALRWFSSLPSGSVHNWEGLSARFLTHFTTSKVHPKSIIHLAQVQQQRAESLREYVSRFTKELLLVKNPEPRLAVRYIVAGLRQGPFFEACTLKEPTSLDEFIREAERYMILEETSAAKKEV